MKNIAHFVLVVFTLGACVADVPSDDVSEESAPIAPVTPGKKWPSEIDENAVDPMPVDNVDAHAQPPVASLGIDPVGGSCVTALSGYCATDNIWRWPQTGASFKCYCQCNHIVGHDANNVHPDCKNMATATMCGTLFDVYAPDPFGGPGTFEYTFKPTGWPTACHLPTSNLAPTVPFRSTDPSVD